MVSRRTSSRPKRKISQDKPPAKLAAVSQAKQRSWGSTSSESIFDIVTKSKTGLKRYSSASSLKTREDESSKRPAKKTKTNCGPRRKIPTKQPKAKKHTTSSSARRQLLPTTAVTPSPIVPLRHSNHCPPSSVIIDLASSSSVISGNSFASSHSHAPSNTVSRPRLPPGVIDIDSEDQNLPQTNDKDANSIFHSSYGREYHTFLFDRDHKPTKHPRTRNHVKISEQPADYIDHQTHLSSDMRFILVSWLIEVQEEFKLSDLTLHLAVRLLDRALSCTNKKDGLVIEKESLQCVGCACMFMASKLDEVSPPTVNDFVFISDQTYTRRDITQMELRICVALKFHLFTVTPYHFVHRFLQASQVGENKVLENMTLYLCELALVEYDFVVVRPSLVAASALYLARVTLGILESQSGENKYWNKTLKHYTGYSVPEMKDTVAKLHKIHSIAEEKEFTAFQKYNHERFLKVALKTVLLEDDLDFC